MTVKIVGRTRPSRPALLVVAAMMVAALTFGVLAGLPAGDVPPAYAAVCKDAEARCDFPDDVTFTSALEVGHHTAPSYLGTSTVVQPDDGERWSIKAIWNTDDPPTPCLEHSETAYATVSWNGSTWVLSDVSLTANIVDIDICEGDTCDAGGGAEHAWSYKLIVDVNDWVQPDPPNGPFHFLRRVDYTTTAVDDGDLVLDPTRTQGDCYLGSSVSPTTQSVSAYDAPLEWYWGRCGYNCTIAGASVTIYYE
jgi:hypothetical protein